MDALRTTRLLLRPLARRRCGGALGLSQRSGGRALPELGGPVLARAGGQSHRRARTHRERRPTPGASGPSSGSRTAGSSATSACGVYDDGRQAELGFTIAAEWQRQGYALEGASRILDSLFDHAGGAARQGRLRHAEPRVCRGCWSASASRREGELGRLDLGRGASGATTTSTRCSRASGSPAAASVL